MPSLILHQLQIRKLELHQDASQSSKQCHDIQNALSPSFVSCPQSLEARVLALAMFRALRAVMSRQSDYEEIELEQRPAFSRQLSAFRETSFFRYFQGWRATLRLSIILATAVLLVNLLVLFYGVSRTNGVNGGPTLYEGHCGRASTLFTVWHVIVNVLSSILLSSSNAAVQVLNAPTRAEVNVSHSRRLWLDIGVISMRNLRSIGRSRVIICLFLFITTLPLHLL